MISFIKLSSSKTFYGQNGGKPRLITQITLVYLIGFYFLNRETRFIWSMEFMFYNCFYRFIQRKDNETNQVLSNGEIILASLSLLFVCRERDAIEPINGDGAGFRPVNIFQTNLQCFWFWFQHSMLFWATWRKDGTQVMSFHPRSDKQARSMSMLAGMFNQESKWHKLIFLKAIPPHLRYTVWKFTID